MKKIVTLSVAAIASLSAASFQTVGYKGISMGGASTSNARADMAVYANPALLAESNQGVNVSSGVNVVVRDHGAGQTVSDLEDLDLVNVVNTLTDNVNIADRDKLSLVQQAKDIVVGSDGDNISGRVNGHFTMNVGNWGAGVISNAEVASTMNVDQTKNKLIVWSDIDGNGIEDTYDVYTNLENADYNSTTGLIDTVGNSDRDEYLTTSLFNNILNSDNNVLVQAVNITEVPVGYGRLFPTKYGEFGVGGSVKFMSGATYTKTVEVDDAGALKEFASDYTITNTFGIDLGLTYKPNNQKNWVTGLVFKNVNTPAFAVKGAEDYEIAPAVRIGTSYTDKWYEVALDYDFTVNETFLGDEQFIGGGVSVSPWEGTSLRAGLKKNLADDRDELVYTAGLGVGMKWVSLDVAAEIGSIENEINGQKYREHMGVAVNLISRF